jgi:Zn-dependent protease
MDKSQKQLLIHIGLFVITFITTTIAGAEWMYSKMLLWVDEEFQMSWSEFIGGMNFSIPFLLILTFHEFGHYFTARYHKIAVTLPYYIPFWLGFILAPSFGTMGAMIRIKETIFRLKHYFDIGISGPLAGFAVAVFVIWYGFANLPETEYIYEIHPEYELFGENFEQKMQGLDTVILKEDLNPERRNYPLLTDTIKTAGEVSMYFGDNLLFMLGRKYIAPKDRYVPSQKEIMHYPWLLAGYLALFFTALNLLPIGQLDGGHILFGMVGPKWHSRVSRTIFTAFLFYAGLGWTTMNDLQNGSLEASLDFLLVMALHIYILYASAYSMFEKKQERLLYAVIIFTAQFLVNYLFGFVGYSGWLLFGYVLGRFLGVKHPPFLDNSPLSTGRKVLGWVALIVFILCFSPEPFVLEIIESQ